jgi:hypothetical protein
MNKHKKKICKKQTISQNKRFIHQNQINQNKQYLSKLKEKRE